MIPLRRLIHGAWLAAAAPVHRRFLAALDRPEETQTRLLLESLRRNARTRFGRAHGFAEIRTVAEFQRRVPVSDHGAYAAELAEIARGGRAVLTADPVRRFLPTSGSATASKLVPWTGALGRDFRRGIDPWLVALYRRLPQLRDTAAYWSISPPGAGGRYEGVMPVGFEDDDAYLGAVGRALFRQVRVAPAGLTECRSSGEFRDRTLLALLAEPRLGLISVWSPTFLTVLLDHFRTEAGRLLGQLARAPGSGMAARAAAIRRVLREVPEAAWWPRIWPGLRVLSCWTHGPSALYAARLHERLPGVEMQGKGLVATEAFVSLPLVPDRDPVLAVRSHFFEFLAEPDGVAVPAQAVAEGKIYRVLVTTGGGLYRYDLGDRVRVTGWLGRTPCLRFVGRDAHVADCCGEKLHATVVAAAADGLFERLGLRPSFRMLAPVEAAGTTAYALFVAGEMPDPGRFAAELDAALQENFHYDHCRKLGQLGALRIFRLDPAGPAGEAVFQDTLEARGMKAGDIKMTALDASPGWDRRFRGEWIA